MSRAIGLVVLGTLVVPSVGRADITLGVPTPLCMFWGSFSACASVQVDASGLVTVRNLSPTLGNTHYKLTGFGFYYFAPGSGTSSLSTPPTGWAWSQNANLTGAGLSGETWIGGAHTTQGVNNAIGDDGTLTFNFAFSNVDWTKTYWGWRGQAWKDLSGANVGSTSIKCFQTGQASSQVTEGDASCGPPTVVPEPGTLALLATGLVGIAGAGVVRRRRNR